MIRTVRLPQIALVSGLAVGLLALPNFGTAAESGHRYMGIESCATSGCHGGGLGKGQVHIHKKDQHANAHVAMAQAAWATKLTQNLGITSPYTSARCTVCHSPLQTVPQDHFVADMTAAKAGTGVSCESCHGP